MGLISSYIDNLSNNAATAYEGMNTDPYSPGLDSFDSFSDIALLPYEYSFKLNTIRQTWNMSKVVGLTSSLSDPFSMASYANRKTHGYKMMKYNGLIGETLQELGKIGERKQRYHNGELLMTVEEKPGGIRKWFYSNVIQQKGIDEELEKMRPGFLDKRLLSEKRFHKTIQQLDPKYLERYGGNKKKAYGDFVKKTINAREKLGKIDKPMMDWMGSVAKIRRSTPLDIYAKYKDKGAEGLSDAISGKEEGIIGGRKRLSLFKNRKVSSARKQSMAAAYEGMRDFMSTSGVDITDTARSQMLDYANDVGRRLSAARLLKGTMWIGGIATVAAPLAATALKTYMTVPTRVTATLEKMNRRDFGSGEMLQNSSIATERQRALVAIREGQLNARSLMGNEAAFMH